MNSEKIIILDFSTGEVHVFPYDEDLYEDASDFLENDICKELGIRESDCQYMVVDQLNIQIH
jgi:hypothetical protein